MLHLWVVGCADRDVGCVARLKYEERYAYADYSKELRKLLGKLNERYSDIRTVTFKGEGPVEFCIGFAGAWDCSTLEADLRTLTLIMPDRHVIKMDDILIDLKRGSGSDLSEISPARE